MPDVVNVISTFDPRLIISVSSQPPSQEDWEHYLDLCRELRAKHGNLDTTYGLTIVDGGGPDALQRNQLVLLLNGEKPRNTVVTDHLATRAIGTMLRWFNPSIMMVPPAKISEGLAHLGTTISRGALADELGMLASQVPSAKTVRSVIRLLAASAA